MQLMTVKQFSEANPAFSEASLRDLIFHANPIKSSTGMRSGNGLESAIRRIGRRVLIDPAAFYVWVDQINDKSAKGGEQ